MLVVRCDGMEHHCPAGEVKIGRLWVVVVVGSGDVKRGSDRSRRMSPVCVFPCQESIRLGGVGKGRRGGHRSRSQCLRL